MLRIYQSSSVAAAKSYYASGLESEGYYSKEGDVGEWRGIAAKLLKLEGEVRKEDFHRLCENVRPDTGGKLNPRKDKDRKVGYDFTFSAPKSVSILYEVLGDRRVFDVFRQAVTETMELIERDVHVRVRKKGVVATRKTGNLLYSQYFHHTTRPVVLPGEQVRTVDPALHCHCYVMNTSFDEAEGIFKAAEIYPIKRDAPYFEAVFHSKLAWGLARLGYGIHPKALGFEVLGVGEGNIRCFSQRTAEIESLANLLGIAGDAKAKAELGALSRKRKDLRASKAEILRDWRRRIDRRELCYNRQVAGNPYINPTQAVDLAIAGSFERRSVMPYRRIVAEALRASLGAAEVSTIEGECESRAELVLRAVDGSQMATTREILAEEDEILDSMRSGLGTFMPINPFHAQDPSLDEDQGAAVQGLLACTDSVFVVEGKAGTGKTSLMRSAVAAIEAAGVEVRTFAPTSQASHEVLRSEGFSNSETIQQLLVNKRLEEGISRGSVLWVDEAGLLSTREMASLLRIARRKNSRVVLSGDRFQHHSVARGDAFRLVVESGLATVRETRSIYRQRNDKHRQAVQLLSTGDVSGGFEILDELGVIRESGSFDEHIESVATDYVRSLRDLSSVLVVAPTHVEGRIVTARIRSMLFPEGVALATPLAIEVHRSRNLGISERMQSRFVAVGDVVRFHQNAKGGFRRGETWVVAESKDNQIKVRSCEGSRVATLHVEAAPHCQFFHVEKIVIQVGERLRLLANIKSIEGARLYNGSVHVLTGTDSKGNLILDHRHRLPHDSGLLDYGYVVTSHASQGKTVGKVIISQSSASTSAASSEQFYVSVSRSRDQVSIWTDDKEGLLQAIQSTEERMLGRELQSRCEECLEESMPPQEAIELEIQQSLLEV